MVCNVSIGKKLLRSGREAELRAVLAQSETLRHRLTVMAQDDVSAFDGLMAAYKLPKATDGEKARRAEVIQASLERATQVPLDCGLRLRRGDRAHGAPASAAIST